MILQFFFIKEREVFGKISTELVKVQDVKNVIEKLEKIYFECIKYNRFYQLHS